MQFLADIVNIWGVDVQVWMLVLPALVVAAALFSVNFGGPRAR